jgi:hypothetical protein
VAEGPLGRVDQLALDPGVSLDAEAKEVTVAIPPLRRGDTGGSNEDVPYFIVHRVGKGKALLLNFAARPGLGLGKALAPHLAEVGVKPCIVVEDDQGNRIGSLLPYRDGEAYSLILSAQVEYPQRVTLPAPAHCYLAQEGRYLGFTDQPVIPVDRSLWMRVLVCLPYAAGQLTLARQPGEHPREHKFRLALRASGKPLAVGRWPLAQSPDSGKSQIANLKSKIVNPIGYHVIRVTVTGPDGQERDPYAANVAAPGGVGEYVLPLAANDPRGRWTVTATDVASGAAARVQFQG